MGSEMCIRDSHSAVQFRTNINSAAHSSMRLKPSKSRTTHSSEARQLKLSMLGASYIYHSSIIQLKQRVPYILSLQVKPPFNVKPVRRQFQTRSNATVHSICHKTRGDLEHRAVCTYSSSPQHRLFVSVPKTATDTNTNN